MSVSVTGSGQASTGATAVSSLTIAGVTTSGTNRAICVGISTTNNTSHTYTVTRGADTYTLVNTDSAPASPDERIWSYLWISSNEPVTAATDLVVTDTGGNNDYWGINYVALQGVDQTTRYDGLVENTDDDGQNLPDSIDALSVTSSTGDLVVDFIAGRLVNDVFLPASGQTLLGRYSTGASNLDNDAAMSWKPGATSVSMDWSASTTVGYFLHVGWNMRSGSSAPVVTNPGSTRSVVGVAKAIPITVSDADSALSSVRFQCTQANGDWDVTLNGSTTVTVGSKPSHDFTIGGGTYANIVDTALTATLTSTAQGADTACTITVDDGTTTDAETFTNTAYKMCISGTQAQINNSLGTLQNQHSVAESVVLTYLAIDAQNNTGSDTTTITASESATSNLIWVYPRRRRR